jgi:hypothetical protein
MSPLSDVLQELEKATAPNAPHRLGALAVASSTKAREVETGKQQGDCDPSAFAKVGRNTQLSEGVSEAVAQINDASLYYRKKHRTISRSLINTAQTSGCDMPRDTPAVTLSLFELLRNDAQRSVNEQTDALQQSMESIRELRRVYLYGLYKVSKLQDLREVPDAIMPGNFFSYSGAAAAAPTTAVVPADGSKKRKS